MLSIPSAMTRQAQPTDIEGLVVVLMRGFETFETAAILTASGSDQHAIPEGSTNDLLSRVDKLDSAEVVLSPTFGGIPRGLRIGMSSRRILVTTTISAASPMVHVSVSVDDPLEIGERFRGTARDTLSAHQGHLLVSQPLAVDAAQGL